MVLGDIGGDVGHEGGELVQVTIHFRLDCGSEAGHVLEEGLLARTCTLGLGELVHVVDEHGEDLARKVLETFVVGSKTRKRSADDP